MTSSLKKLTGMGGDVRKIAALLQKKAPPGHKLAYITEEEAQILKDRGGSGRPHEDTGIPSYEVDYSFAPDETAAETGRLQAAEDRIQAGRYSPDTATQEDISFGPGTTERVLTDPRTGQASPTAYFPDGTSAPTFFRESGVYGPYTPTPSVTRGLTARDFTAGMGDVQAQEGAGVAGTGVLTAPPVSTKELSLADQLAKATGLSKDTLGRLGMAGLTGLLGARQAGRAAEAGQAGAQQMKALAAPYQQQGAQLQAQAQRGELTPAAQQSLRAMQAQAAQGIERRGGVGVMQAQQEIENLRQRLLQQQYDYGLKLSGIGDNIALGAIRTGLQADQYVNQLTSQFHTNIMRAAFGVAPQLPGTPATTAAG